MKLSIIIPTRNRFDFINKLIEDILNQDVKDFEIIVVDQTENPKPIKNCKHIISKSLGPSVSRNIGVTHAKGDILLFLDDDARIYSDFVRQMTEPIIQGRFDAVAGAVCDPDGNYINNVDKFLKSNNTNFIKVLTANPDSSKSRITLSFPGCCAAIKKSVFNDVGGFDESFDPTGAGEDRDMALKLYKYGFSTWYNSKAKLLHMVAEEGGSRDVGSRSLMLDIHTYQMSLKYFSNELASNIRKIIKSKYRNNFLKSLKSLSLVRTKYKLLIEANKLLKKCDNKISN